MISRFLVLHPDKLDTIPSIPGGRYWGSVDDCGGGLLLGVIGVGGHVGISDLLIHQWWWR